MDGDTQRGGVHLWWSKASTAHVAEHNAQPKGQAGSIPARQHLSFPVVRQSQTLGSDEREGSIPSYRGLDSKGEMEEHGNKVR